MADTEEVNFWPHGAVFALAALATVLYSLVFLWVTFLIIRHRAWYFLAIAFGAAIEIAGYTTRSYSIKNPTMLVRRQSSRSPPASRPRRPR